MRCQNCRKKLPKNAKVCLYCEAAVEPAPSEEEMDMARQLLTEMPPDVVAELRRAINDSETCESFVNSIFVGECPKCGSAKTGDCENDPEIDCLLVGRCYDCGILWCTECEKLLDPKTPECPCWDEPDGFDIGA
jgi:hypothetical protein